MKCVVCEFDSDNSNKFRSHLLYTHKIKTKEYYDQYLKKENEGFCNYCGKPTKFKGLTRGGYCKHCCVRCSSLDPEVQAKNAETNIRLYGTANVYASSIIKEKIKQTNLEKYGVEHPMKLAELRNTQLASKTKYERNRQFEKDNDCTEKAILTEKYGWGWYQAKIITPIFMSDNGANVSFYRNSDIPKIEEWIEATIHNNRSHIELELLQYVQSIYSGTIKHDCKSVISPKEIDIYLPDIKLGIEFNGTYWHCIENGTPKDLHLKKSLLCRAKGIRLIHIYEFEDFEHQKKLLKDLILGIDNYPADWNKNNLLDGNPEPKVIFSNGQQTIYGVDTLVEVKD